MYEPFVSRFIAFLHLGLCSMALAGSSAQPPLAPVGKARKAAEEAIRGALMTTHAAGALVRPVSSDTLALVRAAEGLLRTAVAQIRVLQQREHEVGGGVTLAGGAVAESAAAKPSAGMSRSSRRRRTRRQMKENLEKESSGMVVDGSGGGGSEQVLDLGEGSVVVGDLSELFSGGPSFEVNVAAAVVAAGAPSSAPPVSASSAALATSDPAVTFKVGMSVRVIGGQFLGLEGKVLRFGTDLVVVRPSGAGKGDEGWSGHRIAKGMVRLLCDADKVKFYEEQLVGLRARGIPEDDTLIAVCIERRDLYRHKLG